MLKTTVKYIVTLIGVVLIVGFLAFTKIGQFKAMGAAAAAFVMPPEVVTSATVLEDNWQNELVATGSVAAVQGVTVASEIAGKVVKINFESGATVAAGDLMVQLEIDNEEAQLRSAEALSELAKVTLERSKNLLSEGTSSKAEVDAATAQAAQAAAQADAIRATIAKRTIRAPFAGRLGLRQVNLGQILKEGEAVTTLQTLDPIYVNFSLPEQKLSAFTVGAPVRVSSDAAPGETIVGKVTAIAPEVDPTTRNVRVQATIPNKAEKLRAGMFANVSLILPNSSKPLVVPATAIMYAPYGDSVFVIEEKKDGAGKSTLSLRQQFVRLGEARGDFVAVDSGLKAGEKVASTGVFKLRSGMKVVVDNKLAPPASLTPKPADS